MGPPSREARSLPFPLTTLPKACQIRSALLQQSRLETTLFVSLTRNERKQQTSEKETYITSRIYAVSCKITNIKRFGVLKACTTDGLLS